MQVNLSKKTLKNLVSGFGKVISLKKTNLPVLEHVLFSTDWKNGEERVTVRATDLESTLTYKLDPEEADSGSGPVGSFLFPFTELRKLRDAVRANENVILHPTAENRVEISAGVISRTVESPPVDEFPCGQTEVPLSACDGKALLEAMSKASVTVAGKNATRTYLTGIYADPENSAFVGTDGKRLTLANLPDFPLDKDAVIPAESPLKFMASQAVSEGSWAGVLVEDEQRRFELRTGPWCWHVKCINGCFPNYSQVIPGDNTGWTAECRFSEEAVNTLTEAVRQMPSANENAAYLALSSAGALLFAPDNGSFVGVTLPDCRTEVNERSIVSLNRHFLLDVIKQGFRHLKVSDTQSPMLFSQENGDLHVLMPLRESVTEEAVNYAAYMLPEPEVTGSEIAPEPASQEGQSVPEQKQPEPEEQTRPKSETSKTMEPVVMSQEKQPVSRNQSETGQNQQFEDPMKELSRLIAETQETVRVVNSNLREIKKQATAAERHVRNEEKKIRSHEQDMAKNLKLIEKLQESVAA